MQISMKDWFKSGSPWVWLNAGAVAISVIMVIGLLTLIAVRGLGHFWPHAVMQADHVMPGQVTTSVVAEITQKVDVPAAQVRSAGFDIPDSQTTVERYLLKVGNRDLYGSDFNWVIADHVENIQYPEGIVTIERREWGNFYGFLKQIKRDGQTINDVSEDPSGTWNALQQKIESALESFEEIHKIEKKDIGKINYALERIRLEQRSLVLEKEDTPENLAELDAERAKLNASYDVLQKRLGSLYQELQRDTAVFADVNGTELEVSMAKIVRAFRPNAMNFAEKIGFYFSKVGEFLFDEPREANTEGGVYPAIFGTVTMVLIMSIMVTPLGVIAAVYMREYAKQGVVTQVIRIAVNNLAGVPSIVYGVFGLGFFVYAMGGTIDQLFYPEALPSPTFGTSGLLWASITLALMTLPVVIVATEEGLSRIPRAVREGSLALGATKAETLWRVVLPMASPAMMTGVILAVARAAGEVAPLMLVGVVKLAPSLPIDGNYPYLHLDQKFMHLGFHIYDVGFQSPNVEAARPLVYATSLLLVAVIAVLNLSAIMIRSHLREKYKALEM